MLYLSTAVAVSPYESVVADYLEVVRGYLCRTDVEFLMLKRGRWVRSDIDVLAYKPKEGRFVVCEVISYTPERDEIESKTDVISSSDVRHFLKENYGADDYDMMLVVWSIPEWLRIYAEDKGIELLSFRDIIRSLIEYLKKKREEKRGWVGVSNVTMLVLQMVIHFKEQGMPI